MKEEKRPFHRFVTRLQDRSRFPRALWWPQSVTLVEDSERARLHAECSAAMNRAFLAIATYSLFCLIALGGSDVDLLGAGGGDISVPFTGVRMSAKNFLIVGPLILLALTLYFHLFIEEWSKLHRLVSGNDRTARFFNFDGRLAKMLAGAAFYWWTPVMLYFFYWKSMPLSFSAVTKGIFVLSSLLVIFVSIRRCPESKRLNWNVPKWILVLCFISWSVWPFGGNRPSWRPLLLSDSNLEGRNLNGLDFSNAEMDGSNLKGANLSNSTLSHADLTRSQLALTDFVSANLSDAVLDNASGKEANFRNANMERSRLAQASFESGIFVSANLAGAFLASTNFTDAKLEMVNLKGAQLSGAILTNADVHNGWFNGANLAYARVTNANLQSATFENIDLSRTIGLTRDQLRLACILGQVTLPKDLILGPDDGKNCPPLEPAGLRIQSLK